MVNSFFQNRTALQNNTAHAAAIALSLSTLAGCGSLPEQKPESADASLQAEMRLDHLLSAISEDQNAEEMLSGSLRVGTPQGFLNYDARYEILEGKLFKAIRSGETDLEAAQHEVALQMLEQKLGSSLRLPFGPPLTLALTRRERTRLGPGGDRTDQSTQAEMQWSPGPLDLQFQWSQPKPDETTASGVDCNLRAGMTLPAGSAPLMGRSVLEFSGQRCRARTLVNETPAQFELARWSAAWRWGSEHNSALRFMHTESLSPTHELALSTPDYELGLSHAHALPGGWQAAADVSLLRQKSSPQHYQIMSAARGNTDWSATVAVTRELDWLAVTARWAHAAERIWFAAATRQAARDRFSLALDFGAWLTRLWPRVNSDMDVSWDWRRTREGDADGKLSWNFLIDW